MNWLGVRGATGAIAWLATSCALADHAAHAESGTEPSPPAIRRLVPVSLESTEPSYLPRIFLEPVSRSALQPGTLLRKVYPKGIALTARMEQFRGALYDDPAGYCTIGFGHLVKLKPCDGSESAEFMQGLSKPQATELLRDDMGLAERAVTKLVTVALTDGQYAALCDFTFNVGRGALSRSTLLRYVNDGDYLHVPGQLRRFVYANGRRLEGLAKRRELEIELFYDDLIIPRGVPREDEDLTPIDIILDGPLLGGP